MKLCAGGCGKPAVEGGKYHCHKGESGYNACKQAALRQRKKAANSGNTGNVTPNIAGLSDKLEVLLIEALERLGDRLEAKLEQILQESERGVDLQREQVELQKRRSDDDLADLLDIRQAVSDVNPGQNLINGMLRMAGKPEVAFDKPSGPKPLAGADVELAAPSFDDDLLDI